MGEDNDWDQCVAKIQFGINNTVNKATGKTASELLMGYKPRSHADSLMSTKVQDERPIEENLQNARQADK